jgi:nucleotide-binding universal stress UspA family protein
MKTILVATDLSERSDRAVRRALRLAEAFGASCHVVHVVDDSLPGDLSEPLRVEAEIRLRRFVEHNRGGADAYARAVCGDPLVVLPSEARALEADLVVLGLHRPRAFLDRLRETTMERLARLLTQPVLLVRNTADHDYSRVLVPVSFSPACTAALKAAHTLAPDATISAFHAVYLPFSGLTGEGPGGAMDRELTGEAKAVCDAWRKANGLTGPEGRVSFITGGLREVFQRQLNAAKPELVALGAHTRGPLAHFTLGSFAADLLRDPPTDLLLAHP